MAVMRMIRMIRIRIRIRIGRIPGEEIGRIIEKEGGNNEKDDIDSSFNDDFGWSCIWWGNYRMVW
jgi:hypothetical protein